MVIQVHHNQVTGKRDGTSSLRLESGQSKTGPSDPADSQHIQIRPAAQDLRRRPRRRRLGQWPQKRGGGDTGRTRHSCGSEGEAANNRRTSRTRNTTRGPARAKARRGSHGIRTTDVEEPTHLQHMRRPFQDCRWDVVRKDGTDTVDGKCRGLFIYCKAGIKQAEYNVVGFNDFVECAGIEFP